MPTSATGCCSTPAAASARGFTLIELLVVLVILGVLSVAATLTIAPDRRRAAIADIERLSLLLEAAAIETQAGGRQMAWSTQEDSYSFWEKGRERELPWQALSEDERFGTRRLSEGLHIDSVEIDGRELPAAGLLIFQRGNPPLFRIVLELPDTRDPAKRQNNTIELRGTATGRVEMLTPGAP